MSLSIHLTTYEPIMREGDIVLAAIPQADGTVKRRPALVLRSMPPFNDTLLCGISTQLQQRVKDFAEIILPTDSDFPTSGLKAASLVRLGFLFVLPVGELSAAIGSIALERHHRLLRNLCGYLMPKESRSA